MSVNHSKPHDPILDIGWRFFLGALAAWTLPVVPLIALAPSADIPSLSQPDRGYTEPDPLTMEP